MNLIDNIASRFGFHRTNNDGNNNLNKINRKNTSYVLWGVTFLFILGISVIALFSFTWIYPTNNVQETVFSLITVVALAAFLVGSFVGFLFGIPKFNSQNQTTEIITTSQSNIVNDDVLYNANTNLEQISDWLTKILLGAGLVNINEIPKFLNRVSDRVFYSLGDHNVGSPFTTMVIIYFTIGGFFFGYLLTVLNLSNFLKISNTLQRSLDRQLQTATENLVKQGNTGGIVTPKISKRINAPQTKWASDDPHKGKWGGSSDLNGFRLSADLKPLLSDVLFSLTLVVQDLEKRILNEGFMVTFHLHPTFVPDIISAPFKNGEAIIHLQAWGAFTVGVEVSDGTRLELDLSKLSDVPDSFKLR